MTASSKTLSEGSIEDIGRSGLLSRRVLLRYAYQKTIMHSKVAKSEGGPENKWNQILNNGDLKGTILND
jgi:hypothetical protein